MQRLDRLDHAAVRALNGLVQRSPATGRMVGLLARWLAGAEVALIVALGLSGKPLLAMRAVVGVGLVYLLVEVAARLWRRRRPFAVLAEVRALSAHEPRRSFPSRHVASAVAMAVIARPQRQRIGRLMGQIAWALAVTRIGAGLHYPSDALAGAVLGGLVGRLLRR